MLKVLIIDDEPEVRSGLKTIIDWDELGFSVCGEAEDGKEGLEKIGELEPDLVVVDIKMPEMDGIAMIDQVRKREYKCKIILLTGFSDFSYAQRAIRFGVTAYLLKPIDEDELIPIVKKSFEEIMSEKKLEDQINYSQEHLKEEALVNLIMGNDMDTNISQQKELEDIKSKWKTYQIILIHLWEEQELDERKNILNDIRYIITSDNYGYVLEVDGNMVILLRDRDLYNYNNILQRIAKDICMIFEGKGINNYSIAVGRAAKTPNDIYNSYRHALGLIKKRFIIETKSSTLLSSGSSGF